jgi:hypothetical protein
MDAADYFAIVLKNRDAGDAEEVPDWLSIVAQNWIGKNAKDFSALVLHAYQRLRQAGQAGARPVFFLPDPGQDDAASVAAPRQKR